MWYSEKLQDLGQEGDGGLSSSQETYSNFRQALFGSRDRVCVWLLVVGFFRVTRQDDDRNIVSIV